MFGGMIVQSWLLYNVMLFSHWLIFLSAIIFLSRWPIFSGIIAVISTLMPTAGQVWFTVSEAYGLAFLFVLEFPLGLLLLLFAIGLKVWRLLKRRSATNG